MTNDIDASNATWKSNRRKFANLHSTRSCVRVLFNQSATVHSLTEGTKGDGGPRPPFALPGRNST